MPKGRPDDDKMAVTWKKTGIIGMRDRGLKELPPQVAGVGADAKAAGGGLSRLPRPRLARSRGQACTYMPRGLRPARGLPEAGGLGACTCMPVPGLRPALASAGVIGETVGRDKHVLCTDDPVKIPHEGTREDRPFMHTA
eukprot:358486-Chlamydomonas_euryale.AAC.14